MNGLRIVAVLAALAIQSFAQPAPPILLSGRLVDNSGAPLPDRVVGFSRAFASPLPYVRVKTDAEGVFTFPAAIGVAYEIGLESDKRPFLTIDAVTGKSITVGDLVIDETAIHLAGPIRINGVAPGQPSIAALYVTYPATALDRPFSFGRLHLIERDGKDIQPASQPDQVDVSSPAIAPDGSAAGWLIAYENCCTSYPLNLQLTIYSPEKPLREFRGDGRAIFGWRFLAGGKQFAFHQSFPHGDPHAHNELRNVANGRLIAKWDDDDTAPEPAWAKGFD